MLEFKRILRPKRTSSTKCLAGLTKILNKFRLPIWTYNNPILYQTEVGNLFPQ